MKKFLQWLFLATCVPLIALAMVTLLVPYVISTTTIYVTIYIYIALVAFFFLLRSKEFWPFEPIDEFDKVVTILIWAISSPVLLFFGIIVLIIINTIKNSAYLISFVWVIIVIYLFGIRIKVEGKRPKFQFLAVCNHCSAIDDILAPIIMGVKPWRVLFAKEIARIPFSKYFLKYIGVPISREDLSSRISVIKKILMEIKNGNNILIFPEGKRLRVAEDPSDQLLMLDFDDDGAFAISKKSGVPILPVVLSWTFKFKPRSGQWWFSPRTIKIYYLDPQFAKDGEDVSVFKQRIRDIMFQKLKESLTV